MAKLTDNYPQFEKGSRSAQYQQISNFCVNYTEGLLISLMHLDIDEEFAEKPEIYKKLQKSLLQRERTVRHAFQFQIEKLFSDFKAVRKTRLHANRASDWLSLGLTGQNASIVRAAIEKSSEKLNVKFEKQLMTINERLKTLVHRTDSKHDENPLTPENLSNAFLSCIEALTFTSKQLSQLIGLYDRVLNLFLPDFYRQLDLGMYYLDILPELTDKKIFEQQEQDIFIAEEIAADEAAEPSSISQEMPVEQEAHDTKNELAATIINPPASSVATQNTSQTIENVAHLLAEKMEEFYQLTQQGSLDYAVLYASFLHTTKDLFDEKQRKEVYRFLNFYTHLLDNPRLSVDFKIQLSRLSQPLLRLVMVDPFFFRSSNHPVNDFIHSMIDFEIRFGKTSSSAELVKPLFDRLLQSSSLTLDDFDNLIYVFDLLKNAETARLSERKKRDENEQKQTRQIVLELINQITEHLIVAPEVLSFFYDDWQLVLLQIARKIGMQSTTYTQAVEIAKMLAWSLDEHRHENQQYARHSFPTLLRAIEKGLVSLNFSPQHRNRIRKVLVSAFKKMRDSEKVAIVTPKKPIIQSKSLDRFGESLDQLSVRLNDISHTQDPDNQALNDFLQSLQYGSWVEIKGNRRSRFKRGKLKWKSQDNSRFLFIDQRGHKINESTIDQIKQYFADDMIRVLSKPASRAKHQTLGHGFTYF